MLRRSMVYRIQSQLNIYPLLNRSMLMVTLACRGADLDSALTELESSGIVASVSGVNQRSSTTLYFLADRQVALEPFLHGLNARKKKKHLVEQGRPRKAAPVDTDEADVARAVAELYRRQNVEAARMEMER